MTSDTAQLYAALDQASSQVPYRVTRTERGFRVELDLWIPEMRNRARRLNFERTFAIDVKLDETKRKAKLTDTYKQIQWGSGLTAGLILDYRLLKGAVTERRYFYSSSAADMAHALEMKPYAMKPAKAWVRGLLESNGWTVGGLGSLFR